MGHLLDLSPRQVADVLPPSNVNAAMLQNGGWVFNEADMTEDFVCAASVLGNPQTAVPCRIDAAAVNTREMGDVVRREALSEALLGEHEERGTYPKRTSRMYH